MGYDFSSDERYQTDHGRSPVIDAKDKRIAELETENGKLRAALMQIANDAANTLSRTVKPST